MRLWDKKLLPNLPDNQLRGQHKECSFLRGSNWGKSHFTVNYIFKYFYGTLFYYHLDVISEIDYRNKFNLWKEIKKVNINDNWKNITYRGKKLEYVRFVELPNFELIPEFTFEYIEHDRTYLIECLHNLKYAISYSTKEPKGIDLFCLFPKIKDIGYYDKTFWDSWFQSI